AVRSVKSNAILLAHEGATVGVGMGQVNRVDSAKLAVERANTLADSAERARGSVAASDAFFPFADGLQVLIDAGVSAVVQPGGSIRDEEVVAAAEAAGITMYFTGTRHFAH
ncbi:MAG: bifunctional phosphoribosylaminoimidazolecarboxamide formyltransferase/IMP cyclohydrolase, partial [Corynebacterium casei]